MLKCNFCNNDKDIKYIRSERGIMNTTIFIYFCPKCKKEFRMTKKNLE